MKLDFSTLSSTNKLPKLDFREKDGTDPLGINEFYKKYLQRYSKNNLSTVWLVKENKKVIAYFTTSMNVIELDILSKDEKVRDTTPRKYPAMLLGRMGVDKKDRGNGIGKAISRFCRGLAIDVNEKIACRYVVLQTTLDKVDFYEQTGFVKSEKKARDGIVWMYRRLV